MAEVRFWDTSALLMIFDARERHHRRACGLWTGPRAKQFEHATSTLVAIEAVRKLYRAAPEQTTQLMTALQSMYLVPVDAVVLPIA